MILITGKHLPTTGDLMEIHRLAEKNGLDVNLGNTCIIHLEVQTPTLRHSENKWNGFETLKGDKVLGYNSDFQTVLEEENGERMKRTMNALYVCTRSFESGWDFQPRMGVYSGCMEGLTKEDLFRYAEQGTEVGILRRHVHATGWPRGNFSSTTIGHHQISLCHVCWATIQYYMK